MVTFILWVATGCSGEKVPASAHASTTPKKQACLTLNLSDGFQSDEEFDSSLTCMRSSKLFPELTNYIDIIRPTASSKVLREIANHLIVNENLTSLSEIFSRWQSTMGSEKTEEFSNALAPLFTSPFWPTLVQSARQLKDNAIEFPLALQLLNTAVEWLKDPASSERLRVELRDWLNKPETPDFFTALEEALALKDDDGNSLFEAALRGTETAEQQGNIRPFLIHTQHLVHGKSFGELIGQSTPQEIKDLFSVVHKSQQKLPDFVALIDRFNRSVTCGNEGTLLIFENAALESMKRLAGHKELLSKEIVRRWPKKLCGISREELASLSKIEREISSTTKTTAQKWIAHFLSNSEEKLLITWLSSLHQSGLANIWLTWVEAAEENGVLYRLISHMRFQGLITDFATSLSASPGSGKSMLGAFIHVLPRWTEHLTEIPQILLPMTEPKLFAALRGCVLSLYAQEKIPQTLAQTALDVLKSPLAEALEQNPPSVVIVSEALRLLSTLKSAYSI